MLTISVFQTLDLVSVQYTLKQYGDLTTEEAAQDPTLGLLLDFLSPAAKESLIANIARQVVQAYTTDQAPSFLIAQALEDHALGALLSAQWRIDVVQAVSRFYPDVSDDPMSTLG